MKPLSFKLTTTLILFFFTNLSFGQVSAQNKLLRIVKSDTTTEATLSKTIMKLGWSYLNSNLDSSLYYANWSLKLNQKLNNTECLGATYNLLGALAYERGSYIDSINYYFDRGISEYKKIDDKENIANLINNKGVAYRRDALYDSALVFHREALEILEETEDTNSIAFCLNNIGITFKEQMKLGKAKEYYLKSVRYAKVSNNNYLLARLYNNVATLYDNIDSKYYQQDSALYFYKEALDMKKSLNDQLGVTTTLANIGGHYRKLKKYKESEKYFIEAYQMAQELNYYYGQSLGLLGLGRIYYQLKEYSQSISYLQKSLTASQIDKNISNQMEILKVLSRAYREQGDYKNALDYNIRFYGIRDSVFNQERRNEINKLEIQYKVAQKASENKLLKTENIVNKITIRERTYLGIMSSIILILVSIIALNLRRSNQNRRIQNEKLEERMKERSEALLTANQEIEAMRNQKLLEEAKLRFFANISHEFRTPLTLIQAPIQKVLNTEYLGEQNKKLLRRALRNSQQLYQLVSQLLDLSKLDAQKLQLEEGIFIFHKLINRIISNFETNIQNSKLNLQLDYQLDKNLMIELDKDKFEKILYNYISNAIKFTPKGGSITVTVKDFDSKIRIAVQDTGIGIPLDDLEAVFDRFYQTKLQKEITQSYINYKIGTGIGLSLCREYAKLFNGKVWAISPNETSQGSTFYFEFPKKEVFTTINKEDTHELEELEPLLNNTLSDITVTHKDGNDLPKILVVEDNYDLREMLIELLQDHYQLTAVKNGKEALVELANQSFNLIISDVMMPIMDGFEFLEQLKSSDKYRHIPFIMLTARAQIDDKLRALRIGVDDYIIKPFIETELKARVSNLILNFNNRQVSINSTNDLENLTSSTNLEHNKQDTLFLATLEKEITLAISDFELNSDKIAQTLFISRSHLYKRVKDLTGITVNQYIKEVRLQKARELIESGKVNSVKGVAYSVGFKHVSNFSVNFEKRFGIRPNKLINK